MPNVKVLNMSGAEVGEIALSDKLFGAKVNEAVLHAAVRAYLMNQRQGTQSTLTRTEVSGGGKKPWRQKGTGRARQGSTRSPQWTHGGIALGPKPRDYRTDMNKKARRAAFFAALSAKVAEGNLIVVDNIDLANGEKAASTKKAAEMLVALGVTKTVVKKYWPAHARGELPTATEKVEGKERVVLDTALIVTANADQLVYRGARNIPGVTVSHSSVLNVYEVLNCKKVVMTVDAVKKLEEVYA